MVTIAVLVFLLLLASFVAGTLFLYIVISTTEEKTGSIILSLAIVWKILSEGAWSMLRSGSLGRLMRDVLYEWRDLRRDPRLLEEMRRDIARIKFNEVKEESR